MSVKNFIRLYLTEVRFLTYLNLLKMISGQKVRRECSRRALGFIYPCLTVVLYWFVFQVALKSKTDDNVPYVLWLVSALVPYLFFLRWSWRLCLSSD